MSATHQPPSSNPHNAMASTPSSAATPVTTARVVHRSPVTDSATATTVSKNGPCCGMYKSSPNCRNAVSCPPDVYQDSTALPYMSCSSSSYVRPYEFAWVVTNNP